MIVHPVATASSRCISQVPTVQIIFPCISSVARYPIVLTSASLLSHLSIISMASNPSFGLTTTGHEVASHFPHAIRNRTILITGVSPGGIGGSSALALASQHPRLLILAGRNASKVHAVMASIAAASRGDGDVATRFLELDLLSQSSVRRAAAEVLAYDDDVGKEGIDILINNAGVMDVQARELSPEGIESQFATNHIGHFLFTNLVVPRLAAGARIVNVSSLGHMFSPVRFSDHNFTVPNDRLPEAERFDTAVGERLGVDVLGPYGDGSYVPVAAYGQSKTANILFSMGLNARFLQNGGITSFALHPGSIDTELQRNSDRVKMAEARKRFMSQGEGKALMPARKNLEQGCSTTLVAALDPGLQVGVGQNVYMSDCQIVEPLKEWAKDPEAAERLWKLSEELVGEKFQW